MKYTNTLLTIIETGANQIRQIDNGEMSLKISADRWSKKEILGHLVDSAVNNYQRIMLASSKTDLIFSGYNQAEWVKINDYQSRNVEEILQIWKNLNIHIATLISKIPHSVMIKKTKNHTFGKISMNTLGKGTASNLSYLVWDYIFHIEHHLSQIINDYPRINIKFED